MERTGRSQPIDELLGPRVQREVYGIAFDLCARDMREVLRKMSSAVGWKGKSVPFDFSGFSGYWPDIAPDRVDICHGDDVIGRFFPKEDGSLGFATFGEELDWAHAFSPWEILEDFRRGYLLGDGDNIRRAREEFRDGRSIVYGISYGDAVAFAVPQGDDHLRMLLAAMGHNVRFTSADDLSDAFQRHLDASSVPGFEGTDTPQVVRYIYDGLTLQSEKEVSVGVDRNCRKDYSSDWMVIGQLREEGEKMRSEFERRAGVPEGRHFRFRDAVYPSLGFRDDALFLTSRCGAAIGDFITCSRDGVCLYRDYDPDSRLSAPTVRFASPEAALAGVRKVVFSERNLGIARQEYQSFTQQRSHGMRQ